MRSITQPTHNFNPKHSQTPATPVVKVLALHPQKHNGPVRAIVNVEYHGLSIHDLRIMTDRDREPWIAWPTSKQRDGSYEHLIRPVNQTAKAAIENMIFAAWEKVTK